MLEGLKGSNGRGPADVFSQAVETIPKRRHKLAQGSSSGRLILVRHTPSREKLARSHLHHRGVIFSVALRSCLWSIIYRHRMSVRRPNENGIGQRSRQGLSETAHIVRERRIQTARHGSIQTLQKQADVFSDYMVGTYL